MKLRNKKTGEIIEAESCNNASGCISIYYEEKDGQIGTKDCYTSLAELNKEWEDYEEPKEYWYIDWTPEIGAYHTRDTGSDADERQKEIGNYFETKEEAERAVEKLKAAKRLKDKGFRFVGKTYETDKRFGSAFYKLDEDTYSKDVVDDIDLLFGGEE